MRLRTIILCTPVLCVLSICSLHARQQDTLRHYFKFEDAAPLTGLFAFFPPIFLQHDMEMRAFLRSRTFRAIRNAYGDRRSLDALFVRAMCLTNNNTALALLLCAVTTFDHRMVGIRLPVFRIYIPLSNESDEEFRRRLVHLPAHLFGDSPSGEAGDRDKLQHIFGSAFLAFVFESTGSADRVGDFVERGEPLFIVGGVDDDRDMRANRIGERFGKALLEDNLRFPSRFLDQSLAGDSLQRGVPRRKGDI